MVVYYCCYFSYYYHCTVLMTIARYTEADLVRINGGEYAPKFLQPYAETKALGEKLIRDACGSKEGDLLTIAVAPHQVYGPRDALFLPSLLATAASGKLRIFGNGQNRISFCHVDNYCHGLILGALSLYPGSPSLGKYSTILLYAMYHTILYTIYTLLYTYTLHIYYTIPYFILYIPYIGKYYVITDDEPQLFWVVLNEAIIAMGFTNLYYKIYLPSWFILTLAYIVVFIGDIYSYITGTPKHIVNYKLKLNPFAVKMLMIDRYSLCTVCI